MQRSVNSPARIATVRRPTACGLLTRVVVETQAFQKVARRRALAGRVRFVEVTYPRTLTWSLEDYAKGLETALAEQGILGGWLLGESFSSQVVWSLVARAQFRIEGVILAGGFGRHPMRWGVRLAERLSGGLPLAVLTRILFGYAKVAYISAKHGVLGLTKVVALEMGENNITCNAICPAYVRTPLVEKQIADQARHNGISEEDVIQKIM